MGYAESGLFGVYSDPRLSRVEQRVRAHGLERDGLDRTHLVSQAVDSLACRAAVMAGDVLHEDEVVALLEQAEGLNHSHSCPHGRPTRLILTRGQLERWFHRSV